MALCCANMDMKSKFDPCGKKIYHENGNQNKEIDAVSHVGRGDRSADRAHAFRRASRRLRRNALRRQKRSGKPGLVRAVVDGAERCAGVCWRSWLQRAGQKACCGDRVRCSAGVRGAGLYHRSGAGHDTMGVSAEGCGVCGGRNRPGEQGFAACSRKVRLCAGRNNGGGRPALCAGEPAFQPGIHLYAVWYRHRYARWTDVRPDGLGLGARQQRRSDV